jgi:transposase
MATLPDDTRRPTITMLPNDPRAIRRVFTRLRAGGPVQACYEAGACGYVLYRQLTALDVPCIVVAPALIPRKPGDRIKTDRRDAEKLVRLLRAGELTAVTVPTEEQEVARDLVRAREDVRKERTAARHRLGKFLLRHGHRYGATAWTLAYWRWLGTLTFAGAAQTAFVHYADHVRYLDARLAELERAIAALAATLPFRPTVERLVCLRGISVLSAMVLLTELYDLRRFTHPRQLMAYVGLVPSEHSSGRDRRRGGITKTGNGHVRRILVEAAWSARHRAELPLRVRRALRDQPPAVAAISRRALHRLHTRYVRHVGRGKSKQHAMTAVARELCGFIWAMAVVPEEYAA